MPLSGKEMLKLYEQHGWIAIRQEGSHVRVRKNAEHETIPMHRELKTGMEHHLLKRLKEVK